MTSYGLVDDIDGHHVEVDAQLNVPKVMPAFEHLERQTDVRIGSKLPQNLSTSACRLESVPKLCVYVSTGRPACVR